MLSENILPMRSHVVSGRLTAAAVTNGLRAFTPRIVFKLCEFSTHTRTTTITTTPHAASAVDEAYSNSRPQISSATTWAFSHIEELSFVTCRSRYCLPFTATSTQADRLLTSVGRMSAQHTSGASSSGSLIVAGATGATGREIVIEAVKRPEISTVVALVRRSIPNTPEAMEATFPGIHAAQAVAKLRFAQVDWEDVCQTANQAAPPSGLAAIFAGHAYAVSAIATTRGDAGVDGFRRVDHDYQAAFIQQLRTHSASTMRHLVVVSSQGASSSSCFLYLKTKGEVEDAAVDAGFPRVTLLQPGLLGRKEKVRTGEKFWGCFTRPINVEVVARGAIAEMVRGDQREAKVVRLGNAQLYRLADARPPGCCGLGCCCC